MPRLRLLLAPLLATALAAQDLSADVLEGERATLAESRIASSNFPTFVHNLNTGGNDERESKGAMATYSVRQDRQRVESGKSVTVRVDLGGCARNKKKKGL